MVATLDELDVSGGKPLEKRPGLRQAVHAIESGQADVIAAAYFDRLFRSLKTQTEVVERVERVGGQVLAVDVGQVTNGSASQWLSATILGAVAEHQRRSAKERSAEGQARAVARGATPWARVPLGYNRRDDGTLEPDPETVPIAQRVFAMRAEGASMTHIRAMLRSHGIERSHRGVQVMLASRVYLGEIHFGKLVNLDAHEAIIDRELWHRVQQMVLPRGRRPSSNRLLSRLGVLRCGSCGARLVAMKLPRQGDYPIYRCPSTSDCNHHVTISAVMVEDIVVKAVKERIADAESRASAAESAQEATRALSRAQGDLDASIKALTATGLLNERATVEHLADLRQIRDDAQARVSKLGTPTDLTINAAEDWDRLSLDAQRDLIRAVVDSVTVAPGGGPDRVSILLV